MIIMQTKRRSDAINLFKKTILWDFVKKPDLIKEKNAEQSSFF